MKISIVTITYNNFSELKYTLDSIPDYDFIESVVINGGDCQQTKELLESYKGKSISEKDSGIADAFNKGIQLASGDFIMFLNSGDVFIDANYLMKAWNYFTFNSEIDFVHANLILRNSDGTDLYMRPTFSNLGRGMPYLHPTMIFRKSVFDKVGYFNTKYKIAMDFDFIVRLEKAKLKGYYFKESFPVRMEGTGRSISNEAEALRECFSILRDNNLLDLKNFFGYTQRYLLFLGRKLLKASGQDELLLKLKKYKHHV